MKVLLAGGGTLGPVTPLLAVVEAWRAREESVSFVWVGTPHGPERAFVTEMGIGFYDVPVARLPRYPSIEWLTLPFKLGWAFVRAFHILSKEQPDVVGSAGGYTALPMTIVAWMKQIPVWIHQQDAHVVLTNRLIAPFAQLITIAWENHQEVFAKKKTVLIGNPVRERVKQGSLQRARKHFDLNLTKKTVFIFGGGSGSHWLNTMVLEMGESLADRVNIIHLTGPGKMIPSLVDLHDDLFVDELLVDGMADALKAADVVVSRAGLGTITELAALKKPAILVPLPHSPQEINANAVRDGAVVLEQVLTTASGLEEEILALITDEKRCKALGERLSQRLKTDGVEILIKEIKKIKKTHS
jgi:UDP-N-acetylglucosamine--N-acetylmuramyl-(pentapeptide) pyrophosphoryl-undecaprenol N-acetylglucosamine transferase